MDRVSADAQSNHQMLAVMQAIKRLVQLPTVFLWQLFSNGLQGNFQLISSAGIYGTFPAWHPRHDSPVGSNLFLLNDIGTVCLQPVLHDACYVCWGGYVLAGR